MENSSPLVLMLLGAALMLCLHPLQAQIDGTGLFHDYYAKSCPKAEEIIKSIVEKAVKKEARMAASLLRMHFHDCFVKGCDASILLDDTSNFTGEKTANPNRNSVRGFDVVDNIKAALEKACPGVVSCADIVTVAARDSVVLSGGPSWIVPLGRRDSRGASLQGANQNIPAPNSTHQTLETKFKLKGLDVVDLVVLSGGHTIGLSRCTSFKQRLYNLTGNGKPDPTVDQGYLKQLTTLCPQTGTDDNQTTPLDLVSPTKFDTHYFKNLESGKGLLITDEILYSTKGSKTAALVKFYASHSQAFFQQFAKSMIKMGNITPLIKPSGEIRKNCRKMN
ncbi:hypothetical protein SUGI_0433550 [Cryptomeria japonica]|uniref:peroxidase 49 n=1 Tax=Cryptomeria japonica TaxID=3369 RepID=UPI002408CAA2|nr:peroxidase 49 [Cryptomeria japonica]GLJ22984.1 hypothetical protein SUGI_0433550 [Cryptomeria japonica]